MLLTSSELEGEFFTTVSPGKPINEISFASMYFEGNIKATFDKSIYYLNMEYCVVKFIVPCH